MREAVISIRLGVCVCVCVRERERASTRSLGGWGWDERLPGGAPTENVKCQVRRKMRVGVLCFSCFIF